MAEDISRRTFVGGMLAATVVGFDTHLRSWVTAREPSRRGSALAADLPAFKGALLTDEAALDAAADDFGHIVHRRPMAVLLPASVHDILTLVRFARRHHLHVAARGQGHSTQGQAQAEAGVVIDMATLADIKEVNASDALVDGGVRWVDLLQQTLPLGLTPPTLTDFLELSVGGTLAVGGIGSQAFRWGPQIENVSEVQVVTGRGTLVTCSHRERPDLFHAVRAGLGQFGIIVRARVRLIDAPPHVRLYQARYHNLSAFLADLEHVIDDGRFDTVQGSALPDGAGSWQFLWETTKYFMPGTEPDDATLWAGLAFTPGTALTQDLTYFEYINRLAPLVARLRESGVWFVPHPWVNLFVPAPQALAFIGDVLAQLTVNDVGEGPVLINPYNRDRFRTPFFRVPDSRHFFNFGLLRNAIPPTQERADALIQANRRLFEQVTALGGKRYPVDAVPMRQHDWRHHFQPWWEVFVAAKQLFDPDHIFTPGQGIFEA
jgi:cytokinin dehydrogenase